MQTVYPRPRGELIFYILMFGAGATFAMVLLFDDDIDVVQRMIHALPVAVISCMILFATIRALVENLPELVLDATGIAAAASGRQVATIAWNEVAAVRIGRFYWHETIEVILHERSTGRQPRIQPTVASGWTAVDGHKTLVLSPTRLRPHKAADIIGAMTRHHPALFVAPPA
ncbi:hypothetical protein [Nocardia sp. NPDC058705]|uniref:hypothetical protein n=1 Tax=Nocardia sp. NPDC058705 TaxID=3346609 RepID=UPI00369EDEB2